MVGSAEEYRRSPMDKRLRESDDTEVEEELSSGWLQGQSTEGAVVNIDAQSRVAVAASRGMDRLWSWSRAHSAASPHSDAAAAAAAASRIL
eukprot:ctg_5693.g580